MTNRLAETLLAAMGAMAWLGPTPFALALRDDGPATDRSVGQQHEQLVERNLVAATPS